MMPRLMGEEALHGARVIQVGDGRARSTATAWRTMADGGHTAAGAARAPRAKPQARDLRMIGIGVRRGPAARRHG
jgi:hypothetical protein